MTKKSSAAAAFLKNMKQDVPEVASAGDPADKPQSKGKPVSTRDGLKHIGGYLAPDTVEKVAILRARLRLDNSELITLAIDELYSKQKAKRAFSD
jgi:hypothetical protein